MGEAVRQGPLFRGLGRSCVTLCDEILSHMIRCLVLWEKEFFDKLFLAAQSCSFRKNGTVDVLYPINDFLFIFLILGLDIIDSFDCLGSKIDHFIQDMNPAVWSNSEKLP